MANRFTNYLDECRRMFFRPEHFWVSTFEPPRRNFVNFGRNQLWKCLISSHSLHNHRGAAKAYGSSLHPWGSDSILYPGQINAKRASPHHKGSSSDRPKSFYWKYMVSLDARQPHSYSGPAHNRILRSGICSVRRRSCHLTKLASRSLFFPYLGSVRRFNSQVSWKQHGYLFRKGCFGWPGVSISVRGYPGRPGKGVSSAIYAIPYRVLLVRSAANV